MVRVRSLGQAAAIQAAEARYAALRAEASAEDITPELYLLGVLDGLKAHAAMRAPLAEMRRRQPESATVQAWSARFAEALPGE